MSQYNQLPLNFGSYPNDPTADSIYTTFEKTQQNLTVLFDAVNSGGTLTAASLAALMATLPTTLPSQPGVAWMNGGVLCLS